MKNAVLCRLLREDLIQHRLAVALAVSWCDVQPNRLQSELSALVFLFTKLSSDGITGFAATLCGLIFFN